MNFLHRQLLGNPIQAWALALTTSIVSYLILYVLKQYALARLSKYFSARGKAWSASIDRITASTRTFILAVAALYLGLQFLSLPPKSALFIDRGLFILFVVQLIIWANLIISLWIENYLGAKFAEDSAKTTSLHALLLVVRIVVMAILVLWALDNLGVNITTLVAGFGVGGIAVALAVQNILGDLLASFTILLDKPFVIGDSIAIGDFQGTVEHIGIKTTRLRGLNGEQLIFPNADLLQSRIRNLKRMRDRRVVFPLSVSYDTPADQLRKIPEILRDAIVKQGKTRFDRSHFKAFGNNSLDFETVYYVITADYNEYMDIQQRLNLAVVERFAAERIQFLTSPRPALSLSNSPAPTTPPTPVV